MYLTLAKLNKLAIDLILNESIYVIFLAEIPHFLLLDLHRVDVHALFVVGVGVHILLSVECKQLVLGDRLLLVSYFKLGSQVEAADMATNEASP